MNRYRAMKVQHQKEFGQLPIFFAFSEKHFAEGMAQFGLSPEDTDKVYSLRGTGGFYLRTDAPKIKAMFNRHEKEMSDAISADTTGQGFILEMFSYELGNHEYSYTGDVEPTLEALGLSLDEVEANPAMLNGLKKAIKQQEEA